MNTKPCATFDELDHCATHYLDDPLPAVGVEALLLEDHGAVVVLALRVGQADHGQQLRAAQRPQDVRVVVQTEDGLQELTG